MCQKMTQEESKGFGNPKRVLFNERRRGLWLRRARWYPAHERPRPHLTGHEPSPYLGSTTSAGTARDLFMPGEGGDAVSKPVGGWR